MTVDDYLEALLKREGLFADHPADRGGPTMWGITEQVARAYGYHGSMRDLPREVAKRIYLERYWIAPGFDKINEYSAVVAEELLDTGVNMGQAVASKMLQRALNVLNSEAKLYPDIIADGVIGKMTIASLRAYLAHRKSDGHVVLSRILNSLQGSRYVGIAEEKVSQEAFIYGWFLNRVV